MGVSKINWVLVGLGIFAADAKARTLSCRADDVNAKYEILKLDDDLGSLTLSDAFNGCVVQDSHYYYREYFIANLRCKNGTDFVVHANNLSNSAEEAKSHFRGRILETKKNGNQSAIRVVCSESL